MAYVSLYRKYRPQTFDDVVGQTPVIRTLANAIVEDRLHHAYLFTGPRGTGKTSTARILAKAINCEAGPTPTPCNTCRQCREITDGSSVDVIELDMASHGGVDDARELRDRALFAPASARRKVYILDEVHMASTAAFNALLKLIEEPPAHVMFAMATTDPQKVLPTIMSRVQRLDLRRVSAADVAGNVRRLCDLEGYTIEEAAVEAIVRAGDGSLRDTQSVLEQVLAFAGREVTVDAVAQVLGQTPVQRVVEVVDRLAARDVAGLLAAVQGLVDDGHDLRRFTLDLVQHVRDVLVLGAAPDHPDLVDATAERLQLLQAQAAAMPAETLLRAVTVLAATIAEQRLGSPRLPLELALASLVVPSESAQLDELTDRVARLEAVAMGAGPTDAERPPHRSAPARRAASAAAAAAAAAVAPAEVPQEDQAPSSAAPRSAPATPASGTPAERDPTTASTQRSGPGSTGSAADVEAGSGAAAAAGPAGDPGPSAAGPVQDATVGPDGDAGSSTALDETEGSPPTPEDLEPASSGDDAGPVSSGEDVEPTSEADTGATSTGDDLDLIASNWDAILELVRNGSKRHHAIFLPATPTRAGRGILTLRYGRRYASFHAATAGSGEYAAALQAAVAEVCDLKVRLEIVVEGEDDRRRPLPPSVTAEDARTPVLHGDEVADGPPVTTSELAGTSQEEPARDAPPGTTAATGERRAAPEPEASREPSPRSASVHPPGHRDRAVPEPVDEEAAVREAEEQAAPVADPQQVGRLLADELGAELVDELPPPTDR